MVMYQESEVLKRYSSSSSSSSRCSSCSRVVIVVE